MLFCHMVFGAVGLIVTGIWGRSKEWRLQYRIWWTDTPWKNKEVEGSEQCWQSDWVFTEAGLLTEPRQDFWNITKENILYVRGSKPVTCPNRCREQVLQGIHRKVGGVTDGSNNLMLPWLMEEEWTPIELKTWDSNTISGWLYARVGGKQVKMITFAPIKDKSFCQGNKTVIHWGLFPVRETSEPWVIRPDVFLVWGCMIWNLLNKERFHPWDCLADLWIHIIEEHSRSMWREFSVIPPWQDIAGDFRHNPKG